MAHLAFTAQLQRFTETPEFDTQAPTLRAALEEAFTLNPRLRGYVLDEQGQLRRHVVIYVGSRRVEAGASLEQPLAPLDRVHVLQALTGG